MLREKHTAKSAKAVKLYKLIAENKKRLMRMQDELGACLDDMTQDEMLVYAHESFEIDKMYKKEGLSERERH